MVSIASKQIAVALQTANRVFGETVVYSRGAFTVDLTKKAMPGSSDFEQEIDGELVSRFQSRDWIIQTEDLVLDEDITLPADGDRITQTIGDDVWVFEVMAPAGGKPWRYTDPQRNGLRVHTKLVSQP